MKRLLYVEDDVKLGGYLQETLVSQGFDSTWVSNVDALIDAFENRKVFDLIILDRMIANIDTKDWIGRFKQAWPASPILILSAINTPSERTELINLGADDYLGKPFSTQEVVARANALLRRMGSAPSTYTAIGNTVIDQMKRLVLVQEKSEYLPAKEFLLLRTLASEPGRVWSKDSLLDRIWGSNPGVETYVVEATITHLRRKLTDMGSVLQIRNMRNAGYWIET